MNNSVGTILIKMLVSKAITLALGLNLVQAFATDI